MFGTDVSDLQSGIAINRDTISGTLKYYDDESSALVTDWGAGNFIVLNLADNVFTGLTSVKVGLEPSISSGLQELINDPDKNGVFKVTNPQTQKFVVQYTDGTNTQKDEYRLTGLVLEQS